jgi:hypothetical protein
MEGAHPCVARQLGQRWPARSGRIEIEQSSRNRLVVVHFFSIPQAVQP